MTAQYALVYYLGSTILGSLAMAFLVFLAVNLPNGTLHFDGLGMAFLISCGVAMIGSLPFHAWLNWVWFKADKAQLYERFFSSFIRKYWLGSIAYIVVVVSALVLIIGLQASSHGGQFSFVDQGTGFFLFMIAVWLSYAPCGWWIISSLKNVLDPSEKDV
ncbi:MAG: hypothetical protein RL754_1342 [Bacteroidota bacterium]